MHMQAVGATMRENKTPENSQILKGYIIATGRFLRKPGLIGARDDE